MLKPWNVVILTKLSSLAALSQWFYKRKWIEIEYDTKVENACGSCCNEKWIIFKINVLYLPSWSFLSIICSKVWANNIGKWACNAEKRWNENVILTKFSSLVAMKVVTMTTFSATNDENFIKMTTFPFQWVPILWRHHELTQAHSCRRSNRRHSNHCRNSAAPHSGTWHSLPL